MKPTLVIMCGIAGSGKDYEIEHNAIFNESFKGSLTVVSRDKVRLSILKEGEHYFSHEKEVFREFVDQICEGLKIENNTVIANATHLNPISRKKLISAIDNKFGKDYDIVCFAIIRNVDIALMFNRERSGRARVPDETIQEM